MSYNEFYVLPLDTICSILDSYLDDPVNFDNKKGLNSFGRGWLYVCGVATSTAFEEWLGGQNISDFLK